jgi:23S rRNA pseudouridine2605 synthase
MRLNKFIALHTEYSRRSADELVARGRVKVNGKVPEAGQDITDTDKVIIDGVLIETARPVKIQTVIFNKPPGYICSRDGQGSRTIYELIPENLQQLNSVGRLDKESSGLLLLTNDGELANRLTHPRYQKIKIYEVTLEKPLQPLHQQMISDYGITLADGVSKLHIEKIDDTGKTLRITMHEGRNRQIRRTFESLGYGIKRLHRTAFGEYALNDLQSGQVTPAG